MIEIELTPGVKLLVDPDKYTVQGGMTFAPGDTWSNEVVLTFDATLRDVLEGHESKIEGAVTLRSKL